MKALEWIALIIVVIGAINWGLIGLFEFNLVTYLISAMDWLVKTVYVIVGIAGIVLLICKFTNTGK
ncbi:MAG TPA: DUF378 domain-containing protein [Acidobacteriota bacterium]|nr:DUF378 domain-containing protein [Acidobacteriota bacterium]